MLTRCQQTRCISLLFFSLLLLLFNIGFGQVLAQSEELLNDEQARKHQEFGEMYEAAGEWDLALQEYQLAAQAESDQISAEALAGVKRVSRSRRSFQNRVMSDLDQFSVWATSNAAKLTLGIILVFIVVRVLIYVTASRSQLYILPFTDYTNNELGEAVSENIVALLLEARETHMRKADKPLSILEAVEIPSIRARSQSDALTSSLRSLDALDVSGFGLPMGSVLSSVMHWLDIGTHRISGSIRQRGNTVILSAQFHNSQTAEGSRVWNIGTTVDQAGVGTTLLGLERDLAFEILFNTQQGWGAGSAESLRLFTQAMQQVNYFESKPIVDRVPLLEAARLLAQAVETDPTYVEAQYNLAIVQHNLGNSERAIDLLNSLGALPSQQLEVAIAYNLGAAYYHVLTYGSYDMAERHFKSVVKRLSNTDLSSNENRAILALSYCGLTNIAAQRMDYDSSNKEVHYHQAQHYYESAIKIVGDSSKYILATAHTAIGIAHGNFQQIERAVAMFEQAVQLNPGYWRAYLHWGRVERNGGDLNRSILLLQRATQLNQLSEFAFYQLGISLKIAGRYEEALEAFKRAPSIAQSLNEYGSIEAKEYGRYDVALSSFEQALVLNPNLDDVMVNFVWYTAEAEYVDDESLKRALLYARESVEKNSDTPNEWHRRSLLGRILLLQGKYHDAVRELQRSVELNPEQPQNYYFLAQIALKQRDFESAKIYLAQFLKLKTESNWYRKTFPVAVDMMKATVAEIEAVT